MSEALIAAGSAIITGLLSLWGVYAANRKSSALIVYRLEQLEAKQTVHNQMIERMYQAEGRITECEHDIQDLKNRG